MQILITLSLYAGVVVAVHTSGCGCDPRSVYYGRSGRGFCDNWDFPLKPTALHQVFDCSRSVSSEACAEGINLNVSKGIDTDCSCLSACVVSPRTSKPPRCAEACFRDTWLDDKYYCGGYDGNQLMCVFCESTLPTHDTTPL